MTKNNNKNNKKNNDLKNNDLKNNDSNNNNMKNNKSNDNKSNDNKSNDKKSSKNKKDEQKNEQKDDLKNKKDEEHKDEDEHKEDEEHKDEPNNLDESEEYNDYDQYNDDTFNDENDKNNRIPFIIIIDSKKSNDEEDNPDCCNNDNNKRDNNKRDSNKRDNDELSYFFRDLKKLKRQKTVSTDDFNKYFKEAEILKPVNKDIKNLKDLIELGKTYDPYDENRYVINMKALNKCVEPLEKLDQMIGMNSIKEMIVDLIFFRLQNIQDNKDELWHLVIQGNPGCGKTEVAKIIGKIYYSLGIVKRDSFRQVRRSDLIGKYLGHTAKLTQEVFDDEKGGIIFIDEAYSLGNPEGRDSFSKECIDTINQNLTENKGTVVFIAGYKEQLNESFFSYNPGLNRRFKIRFTVDKYSPSELRLIFLKKVQENDWQIFENNPDKEIPLKFFEKNMSMFKYNGGDMENLWHLCKISHARRIFGKTNDIVKKITNDDLNNAFKTYSLNEEFKNRNEEMSKYLANTMYV